MILLDTHAALWMANAEQPLGKHSQTMVQEALGEGQLAVSAISFWEIALLAAKGRLALTHTASELRTELLNTGVLELPLTGDIAVLAVGLDTLHGDPADRFIAATAIARDATLITADRVLLRWQHKLRRQNAAK